LRSNSAPQSIGSNQYVTVGIIAVAEARNYPLLILFEPNAFAIEVHTAPTCLASQSGQQVRPMHHFNLPIPPREFTGRNCNEACPPGVPESTLDPGQALGADDVT
jgi:hypothetical protein